MEIINQLFNYWLTTHWAVAFVMSVAVNLLVYIIAASVLAFVIKHFVECVKWGEYLDARALPVNQRKREIKYGALTCIIFAVVSVFSRLLFDGIWPESLVGWVMQVGLFLIFYETYSYFVHRVLHLKCFVRFHSIHHLSVRVTPWTSYSVHPLEATFITLSVPIFLLFSSLGVGLAVMLHVFGMIFTILLHSNYTYKSSIIWVSPVFGYSENHALHHARGNVNFGFIHVFWDWVFDTRDKK